MKLDIVKYKINKLNKNSTLYKKTEHIQVGYLPIAIIPTTVKN